MPYESSGISTDNFHTNKVDEATKKEIVKKQREFTNEQVSGMSSELNKLNKQFRAGKFTDKQYKEERQKIFKKYDITKEERIRFLGKKLGSD